MIQEQEKQLIIVVLLVLRARFLWFQTSPSWRGDPSWSAEAFSPDDLTKKNKEKFEMQGQAVHKIFTEIHTTRQRQDMLQGCSNAAQAVNLLWLLLLNPRLTIDLICNKSIGTNEQRK